jgi:hypothetical protein
MKAGLGADWAVLDDRSLAARERVFVKAGGFKIPMDRGQVLKAEFVSAAGAVP